MHIHEKMDAKTFWTGLDRKSPRYHLLKGQDVDNQLALSGAAFSLTLDLLNDTLVAHTCRTKGTEP